MVYIASFPYKSPFVATYYNGFSLISQFTSQNIKEIFILFS